MFKTIIEKSNSVNDDWYRETLVFSDEAMAKAHIAKAKLDVEEWNKPEPGGGYGGKMSTRYISCDLIPVLDDTELDGMNFGMLREIIQAELLTQLDKLGII